METKIKPATPLPWREARAGEIGTNVLAGEQIVASTDTHRYTAGERELQNAAYIAHACNAYPRLVAALEYIGTGGEDWKDCARTARALLRDLGESV